MIKAYIDFWKRAFDFSGRSTLVDVRLVQTTGGLTWLMSLLLLFLLFFVFLFLSSVMLTLVIQLC